MKCYRNDNSRLFSRDQLHLVRPSIYVSIFLLYTILTDGLTNTTKLNFDTKGLDMITQL